MKTFTYTVTIDQGIHGRPAGDLVKLAQSLSGSKIVIVKGGKSCELTRLFAVMGLGVKQGDTVTVTVSGGDEESAAARLEEFMKQRL